MNYSLNSLKGLTSGILLGNIRGANKGDTRGLDYSFDGYPKPSTLN